MRITESQLREIVRSLLSEADEKVVSLADFKNRKESEKLSRDVLGALERIRADRAYGEATPPERAPSGPVSKLETKSSIIDRLAKAAAWKADEWIEVYSKELGDYVTFPVWESMTPEEKRAHTNENLPEFFRRHGDYEAHAPAGFVERNWDEIVSSVLKKIS